MISDNNKADTDSHLEQEIVHTHEDILPCLLTPSPPAYYHTHPIWADVHLGEDIHMGQLHLDHG